jgi:electron transport complex protein RnfG
MSAPEGAPRTDSPSVWAMYRTMVGVGLLCGLGVVSVFQATAPRIERNRAEALARAILEVVPGAESSRSFRLTAEGRFEPATGPARGERRVHAAFGADDGFVGLAIEGRGMGYQDTIAVLWGYDPGAQAVVGLHVLESRETPGLGDRIELDADFKANFERLDVTLTDDGAALVHPIVTVAHGAKQNPWEVDGITGATISSKAIGKILDESASYWLPRVRASLDELDDPGEPDEGGEP